MCSGFYLTDNKIKFTRKCTASSSNTKFYRNWQMQVVVIRLFLRKGKYYKEINIALAFSFKKRRDLEIKAERAVPLRQRCTNPTHRVARATKFCTVTPNICGFLVYSCQVHVTHLASKIVRWLLDSWRTCVPLVYSYFTHTGLQCNCTQTLPPPIAQKLTYQELQHRTAVVKSCMCNFTCTYSGLLTVRGPSVGGTACLETVRGFQATTHTFRKKTLIQCIPFITFTLSSSKRRFNAPTVQITLHYVLLPVSAHVGAIFSESQI